MTVLIRNDFISQLHEVKHLLDAEAKERGFATARTFEVRVRDVLREKFNPQGIDIDPIPHPHAFPDISIGKFGVEVKHTVKDSWRNIANSISEGHRDKEVEEIFVIYCKMGGRPEVRVRKYDEVVMHVRTSHVPRFEIDMETENNIFEQFGIPYSEFSELSIEEKMPFVRAYARSRLSRGERLWWLDEGDNAPHTLPTNVRLYMNLTQDEKRKFRAEAAVLCPSIVEGSRAKHKYDNVALYLLTFHGVLVSQARDLFSAGSVALRSDSKRGGIYIERALVDLQPELEVALREIEPRLIIEYWGEDIPVEKRKTEWLNRLDALAHGWTPSEILFLDR